MTISEDKFRQWQIRLSQGGFYRWWWQFWSNYSFILFIPFFGVYVILDLILFSSEKTSMTIGDFGLTISVLIASAISFVLASEIIVRCVSLLYHRKRPYQEYGFTPIESRFFSSATTIPNSFPSRHVASYIAIAFTMIFMYPMIPILWLLPVLIIPTLFARVILGFHYPSDIVAGIVIGLISAISSIWFYQLLVFT